MFEFPVFLFTIDTGRMFGGPSKCSPLVTVGKSGKPDFIALFRDEASALANKRATTIPVDGSGISKFATAQSLLPVLLPVLPINPESTLEAAVETPPFGRRPQEWETRIPINALLDEVARLAEQERQATSN